MERLKMRRALFILMTGVCIATACSASAVSGPKIRVENAWALPAAASAISHSEVPGGETTSAVYFVVVNAGDAPDALIGVTSEVTVDTGLHETRIEGDVAKMLPVTRVEVPAGRRVEFRPGGLHVMLSGLMQALNVGKSIKVTLRFEESGTTVLDVPMREEK